jgi:hypothetical protein
MSYGSRSKYCLRAFIAWISISLPLSKMRTTSSSSRPVRVKAEPELRYRTVVVLRRCEHPILGSEDRVCWIDVVS